MNPKKKKTYVLTVSKAFMQGHPKTGQLTNFPEKIIHGEKIHTIRGNYDLWKKRADEINAGKAILSLRTWTGKPYNSKQEEFLQLDKVGIQRFDTDENGVHAIDSYYSDYEVSTIAGHDGLTEMDFRNWFDFSKPFEGAIIHFTDFRYDISYEYE